MAFNVKISERSNNILLFSEYSADLLNNIVNNPEIFNDELYEDKSFDEVICCAEPITFLNYFADCDLQDKAGNLQIMKKLIDGKYDIKFDKIKTSEKHNDPIWFNSTTNFINLRPGILSGGVQSENIFKSIKMGDDNVHAVVVGRTGSGKSVFLHSLINNILLEYAPWEIDVYMADFKKVELSKYAKKEEKYFGGFTPHIKTCAATSEIKYVVSMLSHLVDMMEAREELFTRLSKDKISTFRKDYSKEYKKQFVLPRVLIIIDEFQQMFLEATDNESSAIDELLMSLIKKGRALGFHLLFCSQEMSGALGGSAISNCKIKIALNCDSSVSSEILGNPAAGELDRGYVLVNTENGDEEKNIKYQVPFIDSDTKINDDGKTTTDFDLNIKRVIDKAIKVKYKKTQSFYHEDDIKPINDLESVLTNENVLKRKTSELTAHKEYFDIITLGEGTLYADKKYNIESFYIEKGVNKNILLYSSNITDLAYLQKLFAMNIKNSSINECINFYYDFNSFVSSLYNIQDDLENVEGKSYTFMKYSHTEELNSIIRQYIMRKSIIEASKRNNINDMINSFCNSFFGEDRETENSNIKEKFYKIFNDCPLEEIEKVINNSELNYDEYNYANLILQSYEYKIGKYDFPRVICWINGIEHMQKISDELLNIMMQGMSANIMFIISTNAADLDFKREMISGCDYLFISGRNEKMYDDCDIPYSKKSRNSKVIDFKIKSLNYDKSFKKYKDLSKRQNEVKSFNFDEILI